MANEKVSSPSKNTITPSQELTIDAVNLQLLRTSATAHHTIGVALRGGVEARGPLDVGAEVVEPVFGIAVMTLLLFAARTGDLVREGDVAVWWGQHAVFL